MFSVMDAGSFNMLKRKKVKSLTSLKSNPKINQRKIKLENIVGTRARSKNGCTLCKKRRKKCDEQFPSCNLCAKKNVTCEYKTPRDSDNQWKPLQNSKVFAKKNSHEMQSLFFQDRNQWDTSDVSVPILPLVPALDERVVSYVSFFRSTVTEILCLSSSNYFQKLFCSLANHDECFSLIIAAWGAFYFKGKVIDQEVEAFVHKSLIKFNENFSDNTELNCYFQICFCLILVGFNICTGDTKYWDGVLKDCSQRIEKYGGFEKLCSDFNYSDDMRFLVSNFQYHDIMSSLSAKRGTLISVEEYSKIFESPPFRNTEISYGVDTLQGCSQPIILILGEILNEKVKISSGAYSIVEFSKKTAELWEKIECARVNEDLLNLLGRKEAFIHLKAFELYRLCCKLNWFLYIKRQSPLCSDLQGVVKDTLSVINSLLSTKFKVIICLPLLMCGICSVDEPTKLEVMLVFKEISITCPVPNVSKCLKIVETAWYMNPLGERIIDWADICDKFDWHLNVC